MEIYHIFLVDALRNSREVDDILYIDVMMLRGGKGCKK